MPRLPLLAPDERPMTYLPEAVKDGRRQGLESLRDFLAESLLEVQANARAPLARQLTIVLEQLDNLPGGEEVNPVDDLARKRAERRSGTQG